MAETEKKRPSMWKTVFQRLVLRFPAESSPFSDADHNRISADLPQFLY